jgi:hypothetical protein
VGLRYDPETRVQSSQWKSPSSPRVKKARQSRSNIKVMMIVFFDLDGIVRAEFVPRNTTVNSEYYNGLLEHLRNDVRRKRPEKWANSLILQHDNAPCHTSLLVRQFLSNKNITVCPHPPYSPDLAPCVFWLFPKAERLRWSSGSALSFSTQFRGFKPGRSRRIFKGEKILSTPSFGGEVKPSVPCRRFAACKRSLNVAI